MDTYGYIDITCSNMLQPLLTEKIWIFIIYPIGSMVLVIYANIWGILMGSMLPYIAYMDPMGMNITMFIVSHVARLPLGRVSPRAGHRKRRW